MKNLAKLKMKFKSKQATCKPCKKKVMEESICQRTTMQRVSRQKAHNSVNRLSTKQIIDHQALEIYSLQIKIHPPEVPPKANVQNLTAAMGDPKERNHVPSYLKPNSKKPATSLEISWCNKSTSTKNQNRNKGTFAKKVVE